VKKKKMEGRTDELQTPSDTWFKHILLMNYILHFFPTIQYNIGDIHPIGGVLPSPLSNVDTHVINTINNGSSFSISDKIHKYHDELTSITQNKTTSDFDWPFVWPKSRGALSITSRKRINISVTLVSESYVILYCGKKRFRCNIDCTNDPYNCIRYTYNQ
jgi:hypothetical protein